MSSTVTADAVVERLTPAVGAFRRRLRRAAGAAFDDSVSPSQREVLLVVARRPGARVREIAQELGLAPNSVSTMVTQLAAAGHLVRTTDSTDRRAGRLSLTPAAAAEADAARARRRALLLAALDGLSPDQVAELDRGIAALGALTEALPGGAG